MDAINELGLDDFLAKLKSVTSRAAEVLPDSSAGRLAGGEFSQENQACKSELSRLDGEIALLESGGTAGVTRRVPPLAQRSAAPQPLPPAPAARSPRDPTGGSSPPAGLAVDDLPLVNFDGTLVVMGNGAVNRAAPPITAPDHSSSALQSRILRMHEALEESRQMRAALAIKDPERKDWSGGYDARPISERATRNAPRAVRAAPPGNSSPLASCLLPLASEHTAHGAPLQPGREINAMREINQRQGSPQKSPPPQLLRKKQQVQQQQPTQQHRQPAQGSGPGRRASQFCCIWGARSQGLDQPEQPQQAAAQAGRLEGQTKPV